MSINEKYITGKSIFTNKSLKVGITGGIVTSVAETKKCLNTLSPGFMDIQINGYNKKDYSSDLNSTQITELIHDIAKSGTTRHFPTIISNPEFRILSSIRNIIKARKSSPLVEYALSGIHIEGPFISLEEGARGAHNPKYIRQADFAEFLRWQEAAEGIIRIVTVSPENEESLAFIRKITGTGVIAAIGHTNVSAEMIEKAVEAGARLSTHLGNGCQAFIPRLKNFIWRQLSDDRLAASIIADGFHLPPYVLQCFSRCKGTENTILTSDVAALAGSKPGLYKWGDMDIEIFEDGHMGLHNTANLAGAACLLDTCISYLTQHTHFSLQDSIQCAAVNPRKLTGLQQCWDSEPVIGEKADFTSFTMVDGTMKIDRTISFDYDSSIIST
ncbi:MAG: hypothetical protein KAQ69_05255 [Spirochaetales bacterium]|nr:hypothetical protein [Spirochaetales bacterium]